MAGYAAAGEGGRTIVVVDPGDGAESALEALVAWLGERGHHELDSYGRESRRIAWLESNGFTHRRSFFDLQGGIETSLAPAVWPTGVAIARYRHGEEDEAVHALIHVEAAWAEVPGHTQRSLEAWRSTLTPEYSGWVARRGGRPVGWVAGRVFERRARRVEQLAVARCAHALGLGRALLLHSLAELHKRAATSLALGVQGENGFGLYRDVGFEVEREWRVSSRAGGLKRRNGRSVSPASIASACCCDGIRDSAAGDTVASAPRASDCVDARRPTPRRVARALAVE